MWMLTCWWMLGCSGTPAAAEIAPPAEVAVPATDGTAAPVDPAVTVAVDGVPVAVGAPSDAPIVGATATTTTTGVVAVPGGTSTSTTTTVTSAKTTPGGATTAPATPTAATASGTAIPAPGTASAGTAAAPATETPATTPAAPVAVARTYTLDAKKSTLYVLIKFDRDAALASVAHDHVIVATGWTGTATWNPADASACKVEISVPVSGLVVDPPGMRANAGLEGETEAGDKTKITENFQGKRQLDMASYPKITFSSTSCTGDSGTGKVKVNGNLTIHGVSKAVTASMTVDATDAGFSASGKLSATHSDFGFEPFTAALGAVRNTQPLAFTMAIKGTPQ